MKSQKGFTLIELLLVLAIIGIISAIAIPALLGQRARSRDKSAQSNATSGLSDVIAAYDKGKEQGATLSDESGLQAICLVGTGMTPVAPQCPQFLNAKNPWDGTVAVPLAYNNTFKALTGITATLVRGMSTSGDLGQVQIGFLPPSATTGAAGSVATSVYLQGTFTEGGASVHTFYKVGNVD
jgi:prepilin-type N-terminal cleavage/methylation domain-containing protein